MVTVDPKKLISFMGLKEWNKKELSDYSGVPKTTLNRVMEGSPCMEKTVGKIVKALGIEFADIIDNWNYKREDFS